MDRSSQCCLKVRHAFPAPPSEAHTRNLRNFPRQAKGAELLRLACCEATEKGIGVCCPVHDAPMIEAPANEIEAVVEATQVVMKKASESVLEGFPLRPEAKTIRHPVHIVLEPVAKAPRRTTSLGPLPRRDCRDCGPLPDRDQHC